MSRRISTLQDINAGASRDVESKYDDIKLVADNIDSLVILGDAVSNGNLDALMEMAPELLTILSNLETITAVAESVLDINVLAGISEELALVAANMSEVVTVANEIASVVTVASNIDAVLAVDGLASQVATDAAQVATDLVQTTADSTQTAADALATSADRVAARADAESAALDRAAVELLYDTFDDRYLGSKASDPALDNDGDPLQIGAIYFNTIDSVTKFYNGASWENPEETVTSGALTATTKAAEAAASALSASEDRVLAKASEVASSLSAAQATTAADSIGTSVSEAGDFATSAEASAVIASDKAAEALTSSNTAIAKALEISNALISVNLDKAVVVVKAGEVAANAASASDSAESAALSEANAKTSEIAAESAKSLTVSSKDLAAISEANAAISSDNAEASNQAAAVSASNAKVSEDRAAYYASLLGDSFVFKGDWDASLNIPPLAPTEGSQVYRITLGGTFDGVVYVANDTTAYDTFNEEWFKIGSAAEGVSGEVLSVNSRSGHVVINKSDVGLDLVDNTADSDKPVSGPQALAIDTKVSNSRVLTDVPEGALFTDTIFDASGVQAELDAKVDRLEVGSTNGIAELGPDGKVPAAQLPVSTNLDLGETSNTAFAGDKGKTAYDHSQETGNPHGVTASDIGAEPAFTKNTAFNKDIGTSAGTVAEGNHAHTKASIADFNDSDYATSAQGSAADNALQPGQVDNISELINDAGFITSGDVLVQNAVDVPFDDTESVLGVTNTQDAIDAAVTLARTGNSVGAGSTWRFNTSTDGIVNSGGYAGNNINVEDVTVLFINRVDFGGINRSKITDSLVINDQLYVQRDDDSTINTTYKVTGAITYVSDVAHVPVEYVAGSTGVGTNSKVTLIQRIVQVQGVPSLSTTYDNSTSGLAAENVQSAIDEVNSTSLKSGDSVSELTNDSGFITLEEVPVVDVPDAEYSPIAGGGLLNVGWHYITDSGSYTLPELGSITEGMVRIIVASGQTPTVTTFTGDTFKLNDITGESVINFTDSSKVDLLYAITHWDVSEQLVNYGSGVDQADFNSLVSDTTSNTLGISTNASDITTLNSRVDEIETMALAGLVL